MAGEVRFEVGTVSLSNQTSKSVTFETLRFTKTPIVTASLLQGSDSKVNIFISGLSSTGFTVECSQKVISATLHYQAVQGILQG